MAAVDASASSSRDTTYINIGVNKGYNLALWLRIFVRGHEDMTGFRWQALLAAWERAENATLQTSCGSCNDCVFDLPLLQPGPAAPRGDEGGGGRVTFVGVDLNEHNVRLLQSASRQLSSSSNANANATRQRAPLQWVLHHAAAGNETGKLVPAYRCDPGVEECAIQSGSSRDEVQLVPMLTVDAIVANLTSRSGVDILMIDAEGHDCSVLQGARETLQQRRVRCVIFEYNNQPPWATTNLSSTVSWLHSAGYECYFQGQERLWPVSGPCWSPEYEFHSHSNVMCVKRADRWFGAVQRFVVGSAAAIERQYDKHRRTYEGKVVRSPHKRFNRLVYLVANSSKMPFRSAGAFLRRGFNWHDVVVAEAEALALLQEGPWID